MSYCAITHEKFPKTVKFPKISAVRDSAQNTKTGRGTRNAKKPLNRFQGCHENALNESCEMSPHLIGLG